MSHLVFERASRVGPRDKRSKEFDMSTRDDSGTKAGVKGVVEEVKGKAKEAVGVVTGRDDLEREGEAQQEKADAQRDVAKKEAQADKARAEADAREAEQRSHQR
jgi:uncharacterized protein YjbJ (UPF0337 family)